jgi:hypothetical protein
VVLLSYLVLARRGARISMNSIGYPFPRPVTFSYRTTPPATPGRQADPKFSDSPGIRFTQASADSPVIQTRTAPRRPGSHHPSFGKIKAFIQNDWW